MFFFFILAVVMVAVYILLPAPSTDNQVPDKAGADEFTFPTNNNKRSIPMLFGTVWMVGNCLEICNFTSKEIHA
jgi:hypothetical protein